MRPLRAGAGIARRAALTARRSVVPGRARRPLVSVVIPAFNEERFLDQCLASVARQNYLSLECIVVDDASTDGTATIAERWSSRDPRIRLQRHALNSGLPASRNTGLAAADGHYVTFLDGDDYLYQNSIVDRVEALEAAAGDEFVIGSYCSILSVPEKGSSALEAMAPYLTRPRAVVTFISGDGECPFPAHAPLLKAETLRRFGGFDATMRAGCEDWDLWQRVTRAGYRFMPAGNVGGAYRMRPKSMRLAGAAQHSLIAARLLERAHAPVGEGTWAKEQPPPLYTKPLGHYVAERARIRRLVRGAVIAEASGDKGGVEDCLTRLPSGSLAWVEPNIDLAGEVRQYVLMFTGGQAERAREIERTLAAALLKRIRSSLS